MGVKIKDNTNAPMKTEAYLNTSRSLSDNGVCPVTVFTHVCTQSIRMIYLSIKKGTSSIALEKVYDKALLERILAYPVRNKEVPQTERFYLRPLSENTAFGFHLDFLSPRG
jgi:hypothetical protein